MKRLLLLALSAAALLILAGCASVNITAQESPAAGARPALSALSADTSGHYYVGHTSHPIPRRYRSPALDLALWEATERIVMR